MSGTNYEIPHCEAFYTPDSNLLKFTNNPSQIASVLRKPKTPYFTPIDWLIISHSSARKRGFLCLLFPSQDRVTESSSRKVETKILLGPK